MGVQGLAQELPDRSPLLAEGLHDGEDALDEKQHGPIPVARLDG